jgi:uncharacterized protein involved in outer membrane biogenesis
MGTARTRKVLLIVAAVLALLIVAFAVPWKINFLRDDISRRVEAATGRAFAIEGDLWWHWPGRLVAHRLRFANPPWAGRPQMLTVETVDARVELWPLLRGRLVLPRVHAVKPDLWLETTEDGRFNGYLDRKQTERGRVVELGRVQLDQGRLRYVARDRQTDVTVGFENEGDDSPRLSARAVGRWRGLQLSATGRGDGVLRLRDTTKPYHFEVAATIGDTAVKAGGSVTGLVTPTAADLQFAAEGPSLAQWYRIAGIGLPDTPSYSTKGKLSLQDKVWRYQDFTSRVGESDLGGSVRYAPRPDRRPLVTGVLVSQRLDLDDLSPVIGKASPAPGATAPPERGRAPKPKATGPAGSTLLPQWHFDAEKWGTFDADVQFEGRSIRNVGHWRFDRLKMRVVLDDRQLRVEPLSFGLAGGELDGLVAFDGRKRPMAGRIDARARGIDLEQFVPPLRGQRIAFGSLHANVELAGRGDSLAQILGTANGQVQAAMGRGRMSNLLLELIGLDAQEALGFVVRGDRGVEVRCALLDVGVDGGIATVRNAVFDTRDTLIEVSGTANLRTEQLDLRVRPLPKDKSLLSLRVPFSVTGAFRHPKVSPDKGKLALRAGGALLLGAVNPLAALLPLIETGPGKNADCQELLQLAKGEPTAAGPQGDQKRK